MYIFCRQKLIIDQKSCYLFGRNKEACDFSLEHTSCSRVHAALVFHRHLNRSFLIDLKSSKFRILDFTVFVGQPSNSVVLILES